MKNINLLEKTKSIEKEIIESVIKQNNEGLEKAKPITEKDDSISICPIRPQGVSLKRYFSSKEKLMKNSSENSSKNLKKNLTAVRKIESRSLIFIDDFGKIKNFYEENLRNNKIAGRENKRRIGADYFTLEIKKNLLGEENNNNKNNYINKVLKHQSTDNTEFYFYNKQEENKKNSSEWHNYFEYHKRPQTNQLQASTGFERGKRRNLDQNKFSISPEKKGFYRKNTTFQIYKDKHPEADSKEPIVVNRKHGSLQYQDLSKEIEIIKVDRNLLEKIKNF